MTKPKSKFEWFPRDKEIKLTDAFGCWLYFGLVGGHQFYLGNKKKAYFYLITCGISHAFLFFSKYLGPKLIAVFSFKIALLILFSGYIFAFPFWVWDGITLPAQVRKKNGMINPF